MFSSHATGIQSRYSQGPVLSCPVDDVIHLLHSSRRLGWSSALFATREEEETYSPIHRLLFPPYLHTCWHVLLSDLYTSYARISRTHTFVASRRFTALGSLILLPRDDNI